MSSALFPGRRVMWMPFSVAWAQPSTEARFCCAAMAAAARFDCDQHADPFDCADQIVVYNEVFDEFGIVVHDGGASYVLMTVCPGCGTRLPESQRDRWFDETEAKGFSDDALPPEYTTGAWRKAAGG